MTDGTKAEGSGSAIHAPGDTGTGAAGAGRDEATGWGARLTGGIAVALAAALSLFHLWWAGLGRLASLQLVYIHLTFAMTLIFLTMPAVRSGPLRRVRPLIDGTLILCSVVVGLYPVIWFLELSQRGTALPHDTTIVFGVIMTLLVLESTRRALGWALPILAMVFLAYGFLGQALPGMLAHRGFSLDRIAASLYISPLGIPGTPLEVSATYVAIFLVFAAFLDVSGAGRFFIDLSYAVMGWMRGGPAKVAIVASALMGSVSGSAVANAAATGTFTIPIMKRAGLRPAFAAAVEGAASTGGQIMPPVMGAAAFIMAEMLGISYVTIMGAALLPALLYFLAVFAMVDFEVAKAGIRGLPRSELDNPWTILKERGQLCLPLIVLLYLLIVVEYTPFKAAFYAVLAVGAVSLLRRSTWLAPRKILAALRQGGMSMLEVAAACACAGIVIGVLMMSGLAIRLSGMLIALSGGHLIILTILTMAMSIILGMGLPTSAVYVILATMVAPAMMELGVTPLAAHMFVFYFGVLANVTPPVAIAAYAAAGIAGSNATVTGVLAFRLALAGFLLPFVWVYNPALLMDGDTGQIVLAIVTSAVGVLSLASAVQGYLFGPARWYVRILMAAVAITFIQPGLTTDLLGSGLLALALVLQRLTRPAAGRTDTARAAAKARLTTTDSTSDGGR